MRTVAIVQARMQSRRLPGKVLMPLCGRPLLQFLVERIRRAHSVDGIIVATGDVPANRPIIEWTRVIGVPCVVGSEDDVLGRFLQAVQESRADEVVRVTADNPLTDPEVIDSLVAERRRQGADLTFADGLIDGAGSEVTTRQALERACQATLTPAHREHVTLIMKQQPEQFSVVRWTPPQQLRRPDLSVTIDTAEEFKTVQAVCALDPLAWTGIIAFLDHRKASCQRTSADCTLSEVISHDR